jgi:hyperosmotically inducible protein
MSMDRKLSKITQSLIAMTAALLLAACAATSTQKSPGEAVDDAGITSKVKVALADDPQTKARQIDVTTFRGVVQLNGFVDTATAKTEATRVARSVEGVQEVHNNLTVKASDRTAGEVIDDTAITAKVKAALIGNNETKARQINVTTREGVVQLSGFVDDEQEKYMAENVARGVNGVQDVMNDLEVRQMNP